jgi:hypothetical protein
LAACTKDGSAPAKDTRTRAVDFCYAALQHHPGAPFFLDFNLLFQMINVFLAIVPLGLATGALVWTMSSGAREQQRSDKWAEQWMRDNG